MIITIIICLTLITLVLICGILFNDVDTIKTIINGYYEGRKKIIEAQSKRELDKLKQLAINNQPYNSNKKEAI